MYTADVSKLGGFHKDQRFSTVIGGTGEASWSKGSVVKRPTSKKVVASSRMSLYLPQGASSLPILGRTEDTHNAEKEEIENQESPSEALETPVNVEPEKPAFNFDPGKPEVYNIVRTILFTFV